MRRRFTLVVAMALATLFPVSCRDTQHSPMEAGEMPGAQTAETHVEGGKFSVLVEIVHDDGGLPEIDLSHLDPPYVFGDIYQFPLRIVQRNVDGDYLGERVVRTEAEMEEDPALMAAELNAELRNFDDQKVYDALVSLMIDDLDDTDPQSVPFVTAMLRGLEK